MKPSLILICISTNWCHNFYDVKYTTRICSLRMSPQHPLIRIFYFQKKKAFSVAKDPPMRIFFYKTHSLFKG